MSLKSHSQWKLNESQGREFSANFLGAQSHPSAKRWVVWRVKQINRQKVFLNQMVK
jgi:hypothetical protein